MAERVPAAVLASATALVAGLLWWGADAQVAGDPENAGTAFAPPDGYRSFAGPSDEVGGAGAVVEHARLTGPQMVVASPPFVGGVLATTLDGDPFGWRIWRATTTTYAEGGEQVEGQTTTLRRLTDDGIEQVAAYGAVALVFDPPIQEVPADVEDGATWAPSGDVVVDGQSAGVEYAGEFEADDDGDGCLRVTGGLRITREGDTLLDSPTDERWCPGRGIVADEPLGEIPPLDGSTVPLDLASATDGDVADWTEHDRPYVLDKGAEAGLLVDLAPVAGRSGRVLLANSQSRDVAAFDPSADGSRLRAWVAHPGGDVLSAAAAGDVVVAGTSERDLVAYGPDGEWRWRHRMSDVVSSPVVPVDAEQLVAAGSRGEVVALDPTDGRELWTASVPGRVRLAPVVDGRTVVVADDTGALTAYDADGGAERWTAETSGVVALGVAGDVLVARTEEAAQGFDLDDGERLWSRRLPYAGTGDLVADLGPVVAVAAAEGTVGLDATTGRVRWRGEGAARSLVRGGHLFLLDGRRLTVLDADGERVRGWTLSGLVGTTRWLSPSADGVLVSDASGGVVEVSP